MEYIDKLIREEEQLQENIHKTEDDEESLEQKDE